MTLHIYGSSRSRTRRVLWAALELGVEFEQRSLTIHDAEIKQDEYLSINPFGRIPAIRDGELTLFESLAINLHLARHHATAAFYPADQEAQILQWSFLAASDLDPWVTLYGAHTAFRPEAERNPVLAEAAAQALTRTFVPLDKALQASPFLLGEDFTIADLNVAAVLLPLTILGFDFGAWPHLDAWLRDATARPCAKAALQYP